MPPEGAYPTKNRASGNHPNACCSRGTVEQYSRIPKFCTLSLSLPQQLAFFSDHLSRRHSGFMTSHAFCALSQWSPRSLRPDSLQGPPAGVRVRHPLSGTTCPAPFLLPAGAHSLSLLHILCPPSWLVFLHSPHPYLNLPCICLFVGSLPVSPTRM